MIAWWVLAAALAASPEGVRLTASRRPTVTVKPGTAKPGDPVLVVVQGAAGLPSGDLGKRALHFYPYRNRYEAISALPLEQELGPTPVVVKIPGRRGVLHEIEASLDVVEPRYPQRELQVDPKFVTPPPEEKKRIAQDHDAFQRAWRTPFGPRLFRSDFEWPRYSVITAPYGDLRMFNGQKRSQHYGTDLEGSVGQPVRASNDGVVVMVRDCFASGNTVVLNHGGGLFTAYFHLSKFLVKEGDKVKQRQVLGLVGKTGRVTGPHLHWGVRADGLYIDGQTLMKLHFGA